MIHRILLVTILILHSISLVQAQQKLAWPRDFRIADDTLHWNEIAGASGYRIRWLGRHDWTTAEAANNRFSLSPFHYGRSYLIQVKALSGDSTTYQDSDWSWTFVLRRPYPTATPTNTPTATPTPTPTRVVLRGLRTPQNPRLVSGRTVAWDPVVGAVGYRLLLAGGGDFRLETVDAPQTEYSFGNLRAGVRYSVQVSALGDGQRYEKQGRWGKVVRLTLPQIASPTPTATNTVTNTPTATLTSTAINTPTSIATNTATNSPTATNTATNTPTATNSPTAILPDTATATLVALRKLPRPENFRKLSEDTVAWDVVEGADRYRVRLDPPNAERILKRVEPPQTQYTFENLQVGLEYRVRVRAIGDEIVYKLLGDWSITLTLMPGATDEPTATATSIPSETPKATESETPTATPSHTPTETLTNTATFTPTNRPTSTPRPTDTPSPTATDTPIPLCVLPAPDNLSTVAATTVAWDAVEGAAGYRLRWRMGSGDWLSTTLPASHRAYQFAELQVSVRYEVQVQALGDGVTCEEEGEWSSVLPFTLKPTATPTNTPTNTPTFTPTYTPTATPTFTLTNTPTFTPTNTPTDTPTITPTATPTNTPTNTPVPPTATPLPTDTPTATPTNTLVPTDTQSPPTKKPTSKPTSRPTSRPTNPPPPNTPVPTDPPPKPTDLCGPSDWENFTKETHITSNIPPDANVCICTQQCKRKRCRRSGSTFAESCGECSIGSCY